MRLTFDCFRLVVSVKEQEQKVEKEIKAEAGSILQDAWKYEADV